MNTIQESERGERAKQVLENDLFKEAVEKIHDGIVDKWRSAPIRDSEGMLYLKLMDKVLNELVDYIEKVMMTGKMANIQLEQEANLTKIKKFGVR